VAKPTDLLALAEKISRYRFEKMMGVGAPSVEAVEMQWAIEALSAVAYIEAMRAEGSAHVTIVSQLLQDSHEEVWVVARWTGLNLERFTGADFLEALKSAHDAMMARTAS